MHSCSVDFAICVLGVCGERARARACVCVCVHARVILYPCAFLCVCVRARALLFACVCVFACVSVCAIAHYECLFSSRTWAKKSKKKKAPGQKKGNT